MLSVSAVWKGEWVREEDEAKKKWKKRKRNRKQKEERTVYKKTEERVIKMMAGLSNQLSKA